MPIRKLDLVIINNNNNNKKKKKEKRTCRFVDFAILTDHRGKNQRKRNERQVLGSYLRIKKAVEHEGDGNINCNWLPWKVGRG